MRKLFANGFNYFFISIIISGVQAENVLDYVMDCSACQKAPLTNINSFSCNVRCEVDGMYYIHTYKT